MILHYLVHNPILQTTMSTSTSSSQMPVPKWITYFHMQIFLNRASLHGSLSLHEINSWQLEIMNQATRRMYMYNVHVHLHYTYTLHIHVHVFLRREKHMYMYMNDQLLKAKYMYTQNLLQFFITSQQGTDICRAPAHMGIGTPLTYATCIIQFSPISVLCESVQ